MLMLMKMKMKSRSRIHDINLGPRKNRPTIIHEIFEIVHCGKSSLGDFYYYWQYFHFTGEEVGGGLGEGVVGAGQ